MNARSRALTASLLILGAQPAGAGETVLGRSCDLAWVGARDKQAFLTFDRELRVALSERDAAAMAFLVSFPLRINHARAVMRLDNARAVQARLAEVFPPAVRSAILEQSLETISCRYAGIMYGDGRVWVHLVRKEGSQRYRIAVINLPSDGAERPTPGEPELRFVCDAQKHRVVIDAVARGRARYRSWTKPRPVTDPPDVEIASGSEDFEGTGSCTQPVWKFETADRAYLVREHVGCAEGPVPEGATGELYMSAAGKERRWWCY